MVHGSYDVRASCQLSPNFSAGVDIRPGNRSDPKERQMPEVVIDPLEVVQIDEQQREGIDRQFMASGTKFIDKSLSVE